jgi:hypothetical protein
MSARARRPTDLGTGAGAVDIRGEYAPRRTLPPKDPPAAPPAFEQDPTEETPRSRFAAVEQATPTQIDERSPVAGGTPGAFPRAATPIPVARGAERSEPIRVISMKDQTEAQRRPSDEMQAPLHVQLRSLAEVSRHRADTPVGLGHLAPPRDPREVRSRRLRANLGWGCVAIALAAAISFAIWWIAGR